MLKSTFPGFLEDLNTLDLGFGFLVNNCVYSRLETSGNLQVGQQITKFSFEQTKTSHHGVKGVSENCWNLL